MTATGRCRRQHQNQCHGPVTKDLCAKHAAMWDAYEKDRDRRAAEAGIEYRAPVCAANQEQTP